MSLQPVRQSRRQRGMDPEPVADDNANENVEQNETALKFLIGTFNERLDKLEGKTDGVQPTE